MDHRNSYCLQSSGVYLDCDLEQEQDYQRRQKFVYSFGLTFSRMSRCSSMFLCFQAFSIWKFSIQYLYQIIDKIRSFGCYPRFFFLQPIQVREFNVKYETNKCNRFYTLIFFSLVQTYKEKKKFYKKEKSIKRK